MSTKKARVHRAMMWIAGSRSPNRIYDVQAARRTSLFAYGRGEMSRTGLWLNLAMIAVVTLLAYTLLLWAFGVELGVVPTWAG